MFKKFLLSICLSLFVIPTQPQYRLSAKDAFQIYGDIFQFLPLAAATYSLILQDYKGLGQLAIGSGSALAITYASKLTFSAIAKTHPNIAAISKRPDSGSYDGFPSGHTAAAFSAAGFMQRRYGWKWGVPTTILATLVGISRVTSKRHSVTQVIAGAILGYGLSYLVSSKYLGRTNVNINVDSQELDNGITDNQVSLLIYHRF